jgi:hypothetical protein
MRCRLAFCAALLVALTLTTATPAERAPEDRSDATHVVVGTVAAVYVREREGTRHYMVEVAVEKVEKGEGVKAGGTLYVGCYTWVPGYYTGKKLTEEEKKRIAFRGSPYSGVPREGERIRVYAKHQAVYAAGRAGKYDGIFPDWFEGVKGK